MRRIILESPISPAALIPIPDLESRHLTQVLRLSPGDTILVMDGLGTLAVAILEKSNKHNWTARIQTIEPPIEKESQIYPLELWMSVIKADAMEWVIEKSVELGCDRLVPIQAKNSVVQTKKSPEEFLNRWDKIARQALKQCERRFALDISLPSDIETQISNSKATVFWADEQTAKEQDYRHLSLQTLDPEGHYAILIGPEGGFSEIERKRLLELTHANPDKIKRVSLGHLILRAETAAMFSISQCVTLFEIARGRKLGN